MKQIVGALFVAGWNVVITTLILLAIRLLIPLRMPEEDLVIGDDAVHGEEAYALWGDGERYDPSKHGPTKQGRQSSYSGEIAQSPYGNGARGLTVEL